MSRSYSSLLRSIPVYQAQLKRTAFRSFAPAAGVYCGPPPRPPRPPPCAPPPASAPRPPAACPPPPPGACALAVDGILIVRTAAIATVVQMILDGKVMMVLRCCLIVGVAGGDRDHAPVRHGHRLEKTQRASVFRREELHLNAVAVVERIRPGFTDSPPREGRGGTECHHPRGCRAVLILDRNSQ